MYVINVKGSLKNSKLEKLIILILKFNLILPSSRATHKQNHLGVFTRTSFSILAKNQSQMKPNQYGKIQCIQSFQCIQ